MILYGSRTSPFVRKVIIAIDELGLKNQVEVKFLTTTPLDSSQQIIAANPLGKIPVLIREDGPAVYDSSVICQYLNEYAEGSLYQESRMKWEIMTLEATGDGILDAAVSMAYEVRLRDVSQVSGEWLNAQWQKINQGLTILESKWMGHLEGPVNMGSITVLVALEYLDLRQADRHWRKTHPLLDVWSNKLSEREIIVSTRPPS